MRASSWCRENRREDVSPGAEGVEQDRADSGIRAELGRREGELDRPDGRVLAEVVLDRDRAGELRAEDVREGGVRGCVLEGRTGPGEMNDTDVRRRQARLFEGVVYRGREHRGFGPPH